MCNHQGMFQYHHDTAAAGVVDDDGIGNIGGIIVGNHKCDFDTVLDYIDMALDNDYPNVQQD